MKSSRYSLSGVLAEWYHGIISEDGNVDEGTRQMTVTLAGS